MSDLKIYSVIFALRDDNNEWRGYWTRVVAKNTVDAINYIANKYGEIKLKKFEEVQLKEGMFL